MSSSAKFSDLHLSAYSITKNTIPLIENLGFVRDEFFGNTHCDATEYHATFRGENQVSIFEIASKILKSDSEFEGDFELENSKEEYTKQIQTQNGEVKFLTKLESSIPKLGVYKACDIHININMNQSCALSVFALESLGLASFKRKKNGEIHIIITPTFEDLEIGKQFFVFFGEYLNSLPSLTAKIKFEVITNHLRIPSLGRCLPLVSSLTALNWLAQNKSILTPA
jgi:hypothetical protein